jgi:hypothetical protein
MRQEQDNFEATPPAVAAHDARQRCARRRDDTRCVAAKLLCCARVHDFASEHNDAYSGAIIRRDAIPLGASTLTTP